MREGGSERERLCPFCLSENVEQDVPVAVYQHPDGNKTQIHLASATQRLGRGFQNGRIRVQAEAVQKAAIAVAGAAAHPPSKVHLSKALRCVKEVELGRQRTRPQEKTPQTHCGFPFEGIETPRFNYVEDWSTNHGQEKDLTGELLH